MRERKSGQETSQDRNPVTASRPARIDNEDESGSTGRRAGPGGRDTGQDHYGQSGYGHSSDGKNSYGTGQHPDAAKPSDQRIQALVSERLSEDPDIDAGDINVQVSGGRVTLDGTVDSERTRDLVSGVAGQFGVEEVHNNLRIRQPQPGGSRGN